LHFVPPAGWPLGTWPVNAIPGAYSGTTSTSASRQLPTYGTLPTQGTSAKFSSLVAVVSFGTSSTCSGTSGAYRIDQPDDLAFLATFGISP
jgi:hypothetical protein